MVMIDGDEAQFGGVFFRTGVQATLDYIEVRDATYDGITMEAMVSVMVVILKIVENGGWH